jgi:hypothetical protein
VHRGGGLYWHTEKLPRPMAALLIALAELDGAV